MKDLCRMEDWVEEKGVYFTMETESLSMGYLRIRGFKVKHIKNQFQAIRLSLIRGAWTTNLI